MRNTIQVKLKYKALCIVEEEFTINLGERDQLLEDLRSGALAPWTPNEVDHAILEAPSGLISASVHEGERVLLEIKEPRN